MKRHALLGLVAAGLVAMGLLGPGAYASGVVLEGVPDYAPAPGDESTVLETFVDPGVTDMDLPLLDGGVKSGVPTYIWWYGCSPTAGGMMVGYWDGKTGYEGLYNGDASVWGGSGSSGTKQMVASTAHITAGSENGQTYGDWHDSASYPDHEDEPECIADFMKTVDGGTYSSGTRDGLEAYIEWDGTHNSTTFVTKDAHEATATNNYVPYYGGSYEYSDFKDEIDACRPVCLGLRTKNPSTGSDSGHSVVGYGYQDDMFQIKVLVDGGHENVTVGGYAIKDTWTTGGTSQSNWYDWNDDVVLPVIDENSVEWWPFTTYAGQDYSWDDRWDWQVYRGTTLVVEVIPEPGTIAFLTLGVGVLVRLRRRRR